MNINEIKELIGNGYIDEAIEEIIKLAGKLSSGLDSCSVMLKSRLADYYKKEERGTADALELNQIKHSTLLLLDEIEDLTDDDGEIVASVPDTLLIDSSFPFVDRATFRKLLNKLLQSKEAKMIFVKGDPKSGMSYLEKYLIHLGHIYKIFKVIPIEIPYYLDNPNPCKGVSLAKCISAHVNLDINLNDTEEDLFKFVRFTTKLSESLSNFKKIPIFFLHDFHRLAVMPDDLLKFIFSIAQTINNNFPKSVFIIAGLNYELLPNWHKDLKPVFPVYTLESIDEQNIKECLNGIFEKYHVEISQLGNGQITRDEYVDGMITRLIPVQSKIDLAFVGSKLSDHLISLKQI